MPPPDGPRRPPFGLPAALRLAWMGRNLWHRVARPLTMGVRAAILEEGTPENGNRPRVLLIRHSYVGGWHLPGGGVGRNETLVQAMRREVREEVGLEVALEVEGDVQPVSIHARFRHGASDHVALFVVRAWTGAPRADGVEILNAAFFPLDALPDDTSPATRRRLAELTGISPPAERW